MTHNDESHRFAAFYYYGIQHLTVSMELILQNAIRKNRLIYFCMEEDFFRTLAEELSLKERFGIEVQFYSNKKILDRYKSKLASSLQNDVKHIREDAANKGYSGVLWIFKSEDDISKIHLKAYSNWYYSFTRMLRENDINLVCIYDLYNYINNDEFLSSNNLIDETIDTFEYILNEEEEYYKIE